MNTTIDPDYVWCIAYVDRDKVSNIAREIGKNNQYVGIEFYVPTIKVLKKQSKGKDIFDEVPLLFNYGFFKIPYIYAIVPDLLIQIKQDISCIYSWVKDPANVIGKKSTNKLIHDGTLMPIATATEVDIARMVKSAQLNDIYSSQDIENLKPGDLITLVGYPFEGMEAEVVTVDKKKKRVNVKLLVEYGFKEINVAFDNVFYTIYRGGYDENHSTEKVVEGFEKRVDKDTSNDIEITI